MGSLLWYEIRSRWSAIVWWGIGLALFGTLYTTIYPQVADQMAGLGDLAFYRAMGISIASFEGFLASTVIMFVPILLGVYAVMAGTSTLAGEEDSGTLELLVTTRLPRWQIVTAKAVALSIVTLLILLIAATGNVLSFNSIVDQVQTDVTAADVFALVLSAWPLVVAIVMFALFLGALLPSRRMAVTVATFLFIASYFGKNMAGMVTSLEWVKPFSLFSYFNSSPSVFTEGVAAGDIAVLVVVAVVFFVLALLSFQQRDVTVGTWSWRRVRVG